MFDFDFLFSDLPKIGFAHHFYTEKYNALEAPLDNTFELVYIKQGRLSVELFGKKVIAEAGSILFLYRDLPWQLCAAEGAGVHSHCSIQLKFSDFSFSRITEDENVSQDIVLQMYYSPCEENEKIKREMYSIVSDLAVSKDENEMSASMRVIGILGQLSAICRHKRNLSSCELISYRVKRFIQGDITRKITLEQIAAVLGKTPNYVNSCFREANGITIRQYINRELVRMISELIEYQWLSFPEACENAGVQDINYGYRLFKKYMGVTPKEYLDGERYVKKEELGKK